MCIRYRFFALLTLILGISAGLGGLVGLPNTAQAAPIRGGEAAPATTTSVPQTTEMSRTVWLPLVMQMDASAPLTTYIVLEGDAITYYGSGATIDGSVITITAAGTYDVIGALDDGQIVVDSADEETVEIVFHGVSITNSTGAAIFVTSADKTQITLADGTENTLTDGAAYVFPDPTEDEPDAALFSKDDLVIDGEGALTVNANYNNGIASKDDLKIKGGVITVNAVNDGIRGKDSIEIKDGTITVAAGGDGLQSNNDEDADKGYIEIEDGALTVTAFADGIQAETYLTITGGTFDIVTGGGSTQVTTDTAKGLKADVHLAIITGTFAINAADDAVHSNASLTIEGGTLTLASSDDAIHSETALVINGGDIAITTCYEGIESTAITINDGTIHMIASDDGINIAGDVEDPMNYHLQINGGYIVVDANGDGIDVNGSITMEGGTVLVNGPTNNGNGAIDYDTTFALNGGILVAAGSSGMAQAPSNSSTQYSVLVNLSSAKAANTLFHIEQADGTAVLTFKPTKTYQSVLFSLQTLANGVSYKVYTGGSSTGAVTDGLYSGGTYTPGDQAATFTISSIVTKVGSGGPPPGPGMLNAGRPESSSFKPSPNR